MTISVLAVDDSRTMRDMITLALSTEGFDVHLAEDGQHGLEVLDTIDPDVIITDINMPRLDGFGFIDAVRLRADGHRLDRETLRARQTRARPAHGHGIGARQCPTRCRKSWPRSSSNARSCTKP